MHIFISWSGEASKRVAESLHQTLPLMLQQVETWGSFADLQPGSRWTSNIIFELERSDFAIVCVTPENLNSPWIHFEIGALENSLGAGRICPFLIGFSPAALKGPLVQYQAVEATKDGTLRLLQSLNSTIEPKGLDKTQLREVFDLWWPRLSQAIREAVETDRTKEPRRNKQPKSDRQILEEILTKLARPSSATESSTIPASSQFVFLVHGRATATAETIARFVEKLGPKVVILQEQPNSGRTVIEKFEDHSGVAFAIVLMTGDDVGGLKDKPAQDQKPRARQNVVLELGYFLARLGRRLVSVVYEEGVELPSDYTGVLYIKLDSGGAWRLSLARELRAAGLSVDLNNAL